MNAIDALKSINELFAFITITGQFIIKKYYTLI